MNCPKCNYDRKETDNEPDWQCPNCGVAYNKVEESPASSEELKEANRKWISQRKNRKEIGKVSGTTWIVFVLVAVFILLFNDGECLTSLGLFLFVFALAFYLYRMIKYGFSLGNEFFPTKTKEENPTRYKVEIVSCIAMILWFSYLGMVSLVQECILR